MLKKLNALSIGLGVALLMFSCSKDLEDVSPSSTLSGVSMDAAKVASTVIPPSFSGFSTNDGGTTWTFTVQNAANSRLANIGSLLFTLTDCDDKQIELTAANVVSASVSGKNGAYNQNLIPAFKEGNGTTCGRAEVTGYVRFTDFTEKLTDGTVYTFTVTLKDAVKIKTANIWARISNDCYSSTVEGPGCVVIEDLCGEGQGYFHKSEHWNGITDVTIGGHTYTAAEAVTLITADKKEGGNDNKGGIADSKVAFAQGVTVLLNRKLGWISANAYAAELATIEAYLSTLEKLTTYGIKNFPTGNAAAKDAAGIIGDSIDCEETE